MTIRVFQYPRCSTCRKALKWLGEHAVAVESTDIVAAPPDVAQLRHIWQLSGLPIAKLFNVSGESYRTGGFAARLKTLSNEEALTALSRDGKLVKRPLVVGTDFALVGFSESAYETRFGKLPR